MSDDYRCVWCLVERDTECQHCLIDAIRTEEDLKLLTDAEFRFVGLLEWVIREPLEPRHVEEYQKTFGMLSASQAEHVERVRADSERLKEGIKPTQYKVTGVLRNGQRFKAIHTSSMIQAMRINLWRGSVWESINGGKWKLIRRVYN